MHNGALDDDLVITLTLVASTEKCTLIFCAGIMNSILVGGWAGDEAHWPGSLACSAGLGATELEPPLQQACPGNLSMQIEISLIVSLQFDFNCLYLEWNIPLLFPCSLTLTASARSGSR